VTDIDTGDAVVISAATSRFIDYGDRELSGLTYRWECESAFAAICADFNGSPTLSIPNAELESYASLDRFYKFKVIVSAIEAGSELVSEFSASDEFIWTRDVRPKFSIAWSVGREILVTRDEQITIEPEGFRFSEDGYRYEIRLSPEPDYD